MFGELRLGRRRAEWAARIHGPYRQWVADLNQRRQVDWESLGDACQSLSTLCDRAVGIPAMPANDVQLITDAAATFRSLVADIDSASAPCIWSFTSGPRAVMPTWSSRPCCTVQRRRDLPDIGRRRRQQGILG